MNEEHNNHHYTNQTKYEPKMFMRDTYPHESEQTNDPVTLIRTPFDRRTSPSSRFSHTETSETYENEKMSREIINWLYSYKEINTLISETSLYEFKELV